MYINPANIKIKVTIKCTKFYKKIEIIKTQNKHLKMQRLVKKNFFLYFLVAGCVSKNSIKITQT